MPCPYQEAVTDYIIIISPCNHEKAYGSVSRNGGKCVVTQMCILFTLLLYSTHNKFNLTAYTLNEHYAQNKHCECFVSVKINERKRVRTATLKRHFVTRGSVNFFY